MKKKIKIVHVLNNGTVLDSIDGFQIPADHPFYRAWAEAMLAQRRQNDTEDRV